MREFAEELLGEPDAHGAAGGRLDYDMAPYSLLNEAMHLGKLAVWILGMVLDPLSLWADFVAVAVFESDTYDSIFEHGGRINDEGVIVGNQLRDGRVEGYPFELATIEGLCANPAIVPSGGAALRLAWQHRELLLKKV